MKKQIFLIVALCLLLSTGLFAETDGGKSGTDGTTLKLFAYQDLSDPVTSKNWEEVLAAFKEAHPDVKLDIEAGFNQPYHDKLQTYVASDTLPDVMFLWPGKRSGYVTGSGKIKDLRPFMKGKEKDFAPSAVAAQGSNGELYELPEQVTATHVMYTNTKLLKELGLSFPKTFEELLAQGETIRKAGLIPIAMDNKDGWEMQSCLASALVERTCGREWMEKAVKGQASFADPKFVAAMDVIKTLSDEEMFSPGINQASYGIALTAFVNEEAVYFIDGGWRVNNLKTELSDAQKEYVDLEVFPKLPNEMGQPGSTAIVAGTGYGMNIDLSGDKEDAAWKWIWFYSGPEGSKIRQGHGALPAYKIPVKADTDLMVKKLANFLANVPGGYVIDAVMDAEGMGVFNPLLQEMMLGNKTAQQVGEEYEAWVAANDSGRK